jgi:hypothetical protein
MAKENFLINPPKRLSRRRRNPLGEMLVTVGANPMKRRKRNPDNPWYGDSSGHRIAALMRWGKIRRGKVSRHRKRVVRKHRVRKHVAVVKRHVKGRWAPAHIRRQRKLALHSFWATKYGHMLAHPRSHKVYTKKGFVTMRKRRKNTWFGHPRKHRRAARKGWRRGHLLSTGRKRRRRVRHNPATTVAATNPRKHRRHRRRNVRRHSYRRNPMSLSIGRFTSQLSNVRGWAPLAITGAVSAIAGQVVPNMVGLSANPWSKIGVQLVVAIGGGMAVEKFVDARHGQAWMIVGVSMVGFQLLKEFVLIPYAPQFAVGLGEGSYMNYDVYSPDNEVSQQIGAFPQAVDAFPSAMNDYPGVGGYPYDGSSGY